MDDRLFVSSGAFQSRTLSGVLAACERLGIEGLELSSGLSSDAGDVEAIAARCSGIPRVLVHNYFPPPEHPFTLNLASADDRTYRRSVDLARTAVDLCRDLGAPFYSVHAGFAMDLPPETLGRPETQAAMTGGRDLRRPEALDRFRSAVGQVADYAADRGIDLLIENNVVTRENVAGGDHPFLLADPEEMDEFFRDPPATNVGLLLDLGHLRVAGGALGFDPRGALAAIVRHADAFHVSWNDGLHDTNDPIPENCWYLEALGTVSRAPVVLEAYDLSESEMERQIALLERALQRTDPTPR